MTEAKKILIIDNDVFYRRALREELKVSDYRIEEVDSGEKALELIKNTFQPNLITIDVEMPGLNGFELFEALQSEPYSTIFADLPEKRPPVIFISSKDTIEDRRKGFEQGATHFLTKPFSKGHVLSVVNKILHPERILGDLHALVVDDSSMARRVVSKTLKLEGINVTEAENGMEAFEIVCKRMSELDIVITDLHMPVMNGVQMVEKIRKELDLTDLPIIFLTGETDNTRLLDIFECGGTDYLIKPFVKEELMARIQVHLERRELTRQLRASVNELSNLNRMKDELIAVCSHDLRSPLHGMLGFIEMLAEKTYLRDEDREGLHDIKGSGDYLLDLINDILDLSKIQSKAEDMSMQPLNASHLIDACFKAMKNMADSKEIAFSLQDNCSNVIISGNRSSLMRAVNNLVSNAIKFTPAGKSVSITLEKESDNQLAVIISDTGIGIAKEMIPILFDKYSRSSRQGTGGEKGTGLGMSIVKEIVQLHNGEIRVESTIGEGSEFTMTLPYLKDVSTDAMPDSGTDKGIGERSSCNLLLVDDNPVNLKYTSQILERHGHRVTIAENGWAAVAQVMEEDFDLVFMDIEMPELDGFETCEKIRDLAGPGLPVIALTSSSFGDIGVKYEQSGMKDFLKKPGKPKQIIAMVEKWMQAR